MLQGMALFRPLSRRDTPDVRFDEHHDGLPTHLTAPCLHWLVAQTTDVGMAARVPNAGFLRRYQVEAVLQPPLDWSRSHDSAYEDLLTRFQHDPEFALDTIDFALAILHDLNRSEAHLQAQQLGALLDSGRSVWRVTGRRDGGWQLVRRSLGPVAEAISSVEGPSQRAHKHLVDAWNKLAGRKPDASGAYREAVRAVEAAAKPIVLPNDSKATLGKMIAAIEAKSSKWTFVLGDVAEVATMCSLLWTHQLDRHGTDDEAAPLTVSLEQADAAIHLAITLVRYFAGGLVKVA
jgi:hypothetical protein